MGEKIRIEIGNPKTLQIIMELFSDEDHPCSMIWGDLILTLNGEFVWCTEREQGGEAPVTWSWIDLLEFLGDKWPWLILEERYPIPINPLHPGTIRREAEKRWEGMGEEQYLDEDEALFHFEARHDLSLGLKGIFLPSLFILRQGKRAWVYNQETYLLCSFEEIKTSLTQLGDYLAAYAATGASNRGKRAVCRWRERTKRVDELFLELRSGMPEELRKKLEKEIPSAEFWELEDTSDNDDNELLAAARLSGGVVSLDDQKIILDCIKQTTTRKTDLFDIISKILPELDEVSRPYVQGHRVAQLLRRELNLDDESKAEPETLLGQWGVDVREQAGPQTWAQKYFGA